MKKILGIVFAVVIALGVSGCSENKKWYDHATLHKSTIEVWKKATKEDKLATSADWILTASPRISSEIKSSGSIDNLKPYANELVECIDKSINGVDTINNQQTTQSAIMCMTLMGWLK
jgi:hypothetical protein